MPDVNKNAEQLEAASSQTEESTLSIMEAKVEAKLEAMQDKANDIGDDTILDNDEPDATPEPDGTDDTETNDATKDASDDSPMVPSGYTRAALARGYTQEEIDHYVETKPDEAVARFGEIFNEWQKENSRWSERGRQLLDAEKVVPPGEVTKSVKPSNLSRLDANELIEKFGEEVNEEFIRAIVDKTNVMYDKATEKIAKSEDFLRNSEEQALGTAIEDFFGSEEMKTFEDTYGVDPASLTTEQTTNRMELLKHADIMSRGAAAHGINVTVRDVLGRAHTLVSQGSRDEAIRQSIRKSMKKRTKTTKSSHQKTPALGAGDSISDDEMIKRTDARLRKFRST